MMNPLALLSAKSSLLVAAVALSSCCRSCDALSITNVMVSSRRAALKSKTSSLYRLSTLDHYGDKLSAGRSDDEDELLQQREESNAHLNLCSASSFAHMKNPSASDVNFDIFGWNEFVQKILLSSEPQQRNNFNVVLCAAAMSAVIGMQPLSAVANDSNKNIMGDGLNYQQGAVTTVTTSSNNAIKSSSILASTSSELRVKIDDTINTKKPSESTTSSPSKLSMGVKIEYYPEEIEMKAQAEREALESKKAQEEQEKKIEAEKQQQMLVKAEEEKKAMEAKMVQEKAAAAAAPAVVGSSSVATTTSTAKVVEQSIQQQVSPAPPSTVQAAESTQTPPAPKINTEKEELMKMLRDVSTTSTMKKQVPPALSQVVDKPIKNDMDVSAKEADKKQLELFKVVGVGAVGAGLINAVTSKKKGTKNNESISNGDNNGNSNLPLSSSSSDPSSSPLVELKTPKPPSEPPIPPGDKRLAEVLGLLEDDLQELNKNLELLENDLNDLNEDLDSLEDGGGSNVPSADVASTAATVSGGSYLDSLSGGSSRFEPKRVGVSAGSYLDSLTVGDNPKEAAGSYLDSLAGSTSFEKRTGSIITNAGGLRGYLDSLADSSQFESDQSVSSSGATLSNTANAQGRIVETKSRRLRIDASITSDVNVDRATPPFPGQSSTRLQMFGVKHRRGGRHSTRLYMMSQQSDEEESMFPSTDAMIELLIQQKMEKDRRDAELRAQQQQKQAEQEAAALKAKQEEEERILLAEQQAKEEEERLAAEEQRAREEAEQRAREEQERLLLEQKAKEDAALQMQLQMRMMAAEKKAEEERMMMEQRAKEEEAEKLRQQQEEVERLAKERRHREEEEAKLKAWEEEQERLLLEEKAKEEAEMKVFEERLAAEQRVKEAAKLEQQQQQHEEEIRLKKENEELLQIEQNMSYLNDALAQVDDRLEALNSYESESEVDYLDDDEGIQYMNSAVSEIDNLLSEDGY